MSDTTQTEEKLGFLDSISALLGRKPKPEVAPTPQAAESFAKLDAEFQAAIGTLDKKVQEYERATEQAKAGAGGVSADRLAERKRRLQATHRAIREDIEKMHARLGTGLSGADLDTLAAALREMERDAAAGRHSHELLPRGRFAIAHRLQHEAGELAVARLIALLEAAHMEWPDPNYWPRATPEQVEQARRRRRADVREAFLGQGFERTAERMLGIVSAWVEDYPERESLLWQETVLEGVASGIRARLLEDFVALLRADRETLLGRVEDSIGKQVAAVQDVVQKGVHSLDQANQAVASTLKVVDEVVPEIAWEHVRSKLPQARGEA